MKVIENLVSNLFATPGGFLANERSQGKDSTWCSNNRFSVSFNSSKLDLDLDLDLVRGATPRESLGACSFDTPSHHLGK